MLLALAATTTVEGNGGTRVEIRVSATIQSGVSVRADRVASDVYLLDSATSQSSRACDAADTPKPDCRLIIHDLP
jgi:hypothetical protein